MKLATFILQLFYRRIFKRFKFFKLKPSRIMYAVVEYLGLSDDSETSNEIAVVPSKWLYKQNKRCFWPNRLGKFATFDDLVKANIDSKSTWPIYKVFTVHLKTDDFEKAEEEVTNLLREKNYESNTSNISLSRKKLPSENLHGANLSKTLMHGGNDDQGAPATTLTVTEDYSRSSTPKNFSETVLQQILLLKSTVEQQSIMITEILRNSRMKLQDDVPDKIPNGFPTLPFHTLEEFMDFDLKIVEDELTAKYLKSKLAAVGGSGLEHIVRRIMKHLFTYEVGSNFNWKGRGDKKSFENTNTVRVIRDAAKQNFPPNEKNDLVIENQIKDWLKYCPNKMALLNKKK